MAITAAEIHNMSFSIDRKGYDVDEVDVFLEHVADEIDAMNNQIAQLEGQLDDRFDGFDTPAHIEPVQAGVSDQVLAEKDARIAELERQLEAKKADDNAIAQALIIAQRSADEIMANANAQAAGTIQDAKDEAQRILDRVENEKQEVLDAIKKLEDDREDARDEYQDLLKDFISDATRKLAEIGGDLSSSAYASAHARPTATSPRGRVSRVRLDRPRDVACPGAHQRGRRPDLCHAADHGRRRRPRYPEALGGREGPVRLRRRGRLLRVRGNRLDWFRRPTAAGTGRRRGRLLPVPDCEDLACPKNPS